MVNKRKDDDKEWNVTNVLKGLEFPADKTLLVQCACVNRSSDSIIEVIKNMPDTEYSSMSDVFKHYGGVVHAERERARIASDLAKPAGAVSGMADSSKDSMRPNDVDRMNVIDAAVQNLAGNVAVINSLVEDFDGRLSKMVQSAVEKREKIENKISEIEKKQKEVDECLKNL